MRIAGTWLSTPRTISSTRMAYAGDLGVPREVWDPVQGGTKRRGGSPPVPVPYFEWCAAEGIDPFDVGDAATMEAWRDAMRAAGLGCSVQARRFTAVRQWYVAAAAQGKAVVPPTVKPLEPVASHQAGELTVDVVRALRMAAARNSSPNQQRDALMVDLLAIAALDGGEVVALNCGDVITDADGQHQLVVGRGRRHVTVPVDLGQRLTAFIASRRAAEADGVHERGVLVDEDVDQRPVFVTRRGSRLATQQTLRKLVHHLSSVLEPDASDPQERAAAALLGSLTRSPSLRHFRAFAVSTARAAGVPDSVVRAWLGDQAAGVGHGGTDLAPSVVVARAVSAAVGANTAASGETNDDGV